MRTRSLVLAAAGIGVLALGGRVASGLPQNPPQDRKAAFAGFPASRSSPRPSPRARS